MSDTGETYFAAYRVRQAEDDRGCRPLSLLVRPAELKDIDDLAALHCEREGSDRIEQRERFYKEVSKDSAWQRRLLLVAEAEDRLVGYARAAYFEPAFDAPSNTAPAGWYLAGVIVTPSFRRMGVGAELTSRRLDWIAQRADAAFYFVNALNRASIALHAGFHFEEITRDFIYPGAVFRGGVGVLFRAALSAERKRHEE